MEKKGKVRTSDAQLNAALRRAKDFAQDEKRVKSAKYDPKSDQIALVFDDEVELRLPRKYLQGLENAPSEQVSNIVIEDGGTSLHWPALDVDHYVLGLLSSVFGTRQWMVALGRSGGIKRTAEKARAARENGKRGGRPPTRARAVGKVKTSRKAIKAAS